MQGLSAQATATSLTGQLAIPLFTDGSQPYVGTYDSGKQQLGFAGRISINPALLSDTEALSVYLDSGTTPLGDPARPADMAARLKSAEIRTPNGKISAGSAADGVDVGHFVSRIITTQAMRASAANEQQEAQSQVVSQLQERATMKSGVSVDEEMAHLVELQMAYQANARVVKTFQDMLSMLMEI